MDRSQRGTHPVTAAIIYAFAAFLLAAVPAVALVLAFDREPGSGAGLFIIALQALAALAAGVYGARRHKSGSEW